MIPYIFVITVLEEKMNEQSLFQTDVYVFHLL